MFGNKIGWILSMIIAGLMGWGIFTLGAAPAIAKPSGKFKNLATPIHLPMSPDEALPGLMTEDRDAGDQYRQAIQLYLEDRRAYDKDKQYDRRDKLPAIKLLVEAASARKASIFSATPETLVNYRYPWPELDVLMKLGMISNSIAFTAQARGDEATTKTYAGATFALGAKLYEERLTHGELDAGQKLMQTAGDTFKALAKRIGDIAAELHWQKFGEQTAAYYKQNIQALYQNLARDSGADAGDTFALAMQNPDRMWRVESILKIGRFKFNASRYGDQVGAKRMLENPEKYKYADWSKDKDPAIRAAAKAAKELTIEQFRMIQ